MLSELRHQIRVICNGVELQMDVPPQNINGRVLVPMRAIFESLGASITWNDSNKTVISNLNGKTITLTVDSKTAYVNGGKKTLDVLAKIINNRVLVPVRFIAKNLGTMFFGIKISYQYIADISSEK